MPIKINLLAEAKIAEDLRRRDPVKRAILGGVFFIVLALVWSSSIQLEILREKNSAAQTEAGINANSEAYQQALDCQKKITEAKNRLASLQKLTQARFLQGNFLNALQQLNTDGVRLTQVRLDQSYFAVPATPSTTNNNHIMPGRPATTTEKIVMTLTARDSSASLGDQVNKFKDAVSSQAYFKEILIQTNGVLLTSLSGAQTDQTGHPYVAFTLESTFSEKTR
jgi:hypothetical protein